MDYTIAKAPVYFSCFCKTKVKKGNILYWQTAPNISNHTQILMFYFKAFVIRKHILPEKWPIKTVLEPDLIFDFYYHQICADAICHMFFGMPFKLCKVDDTVLQFFQLLSYYFQNLEVIFHNSRQKTLNQWSKCIFFKTNYFLNCLYTMLLTLRSFFSFNKNPLFIHQSTTVSKGNSHIKFQMSVFSFP